MNIDEIYPWVQLSIYGLMVVFVIRRYIWFYYIRRLHINNVVYYCDKTNANVQLFFKATAFHPVQYIYLYFWKNQLRDFIYYPELFDEVNQYIVKANQEFLNNLLKLLQTDAKENQVGILANNKTDQNELK